MRKILLKQLLRFMLVAVLAIASPMALATNLANGAEVFSVHCAACHASGGNIVRRGKNLKQKALQRYGMDSVAAIASLVENGKNAMPAYKNRLTEPQIQAVATYVLDQADNNWK